MKCECGLPLREIGDFCRECGSWLCGCGEVHPDEVQACPREPSLRYFLASG